MEVTSVTGSCSWWISSRASGKTLHCAGNKAPGRRAGESPSPGDVQTHLEKTLNKLLQVEISPALSRGWKRDLYGNCSVIHAAAEPNYKGRACPSSGYMAPYEAFHTDPHPVTAWCSAHEQF